MSGKNRAFALAGAAALAVLPPALTLRPASAAPCYGDCKPGVVRLNGGSLRYDAPVGADDQITIAAGSGFLTVTDRTAVFGAGDGCTMVTAHEARCATANPFSAVVRGLDGDDVITDTTSLTTRMLGGPGSDRLVGGSGDDTLVGEFGADVLLGGGGSDTASYADTAGRSGVRADLDGAAGDDGGADDGPAGARDSIGADVENLEGSIRDDVLIGGAGPNTIVGGGGRDQVQGLGGGDRLTGTGGGTVDGGAGGDHCTSDLRGL